MVCNRISNKLFAAKGEKQDMSTGENIKRIRKFRGMTQKELGIAIESEKKVQVQEWHNMKLTIEH